MNIISGEKFQQLCGQSISKLEAQKDLKNRLKVLM